MERLPARIMRRIVVAGGPRGFDGSADATQHRAFAQGEGTRAMTTMKALLCAAALLAATPFACSAQQAPAAASAQADDAQIDRLMAAMHMRESVDAMLPQVQAAQKQMMEQALAGHDLDDAQRARIDAFLENSRQRMRETLAWDRLEPLYRDIYKKTFSHDELEAMIGFYGSPAGQQVVAKMPQLMQNTMQATQALIAPMMTRLSQDVAALAAE
jgi:hypothetical protein